MRWWNETPVASSRVRWAAQVPVPCRTDIHVVTVTGVSVTDPTARNPIEPGSLSVSGDTTRHPTEETVAAAFGDTPRSGCWTAARRCLTVLDAATVPVAVSAINDHAVVVAASVIAARLVTVRHVRTVAAVLARQDHPTGTPDPGWLWEQFHCWDTITDDPVTRFVGAVPVTVFGSDTPNRRRWEHEWPSPPLLPVDTTAARWWHNQGHTPTSAARLFRSLTEPAPRTGTPGP